MWAIFGHSWTLKKLRISQVIPKSGGKKIYISLSRYLIYISASCSSAFCKGHVPEYMLRKLIEQIFIRIWKCLVTGHQKLVTESPGQECDNKIVT